MAQIVTQLLLIVSSSWIETNPQLTHPKFARIPSPDNPLTIPTKTII